MIKPPPEITSAIAHRHIMAVAVPPGRFPGMHRAPYAITTAGQRASVTAIPFRLTLSPETALVTNISSQPLRFVRFMVVGADLWADHLEQTLPPRASVNLGLPKLPLHTLLGVRWLDAAGAEFVWSHPLA